MIEDSLEEELLHEFKGATLAINSESKHNDLITPDNSIDVDNETKINNNWCKNIIPSKITTNLWSAKPSKENTIQASIHLAENPNNYFTFRESVLAKALTECKEQFLDEEADGPLIEAFLLTQISHWNSDKERLLLLTSKTLVVCKYDFIALRRLSYQKLPLNLIDEIIYGELVYPNKSLIPQLTGIVDGVSNVLETCLFTKWSKGGNKIGNFYKPSNRNMKGIRLAWNKNKPLNFASYWNPFNDDIPFITFTFHPLYYHEDCGDEKMKQLYSLDSFMETISSLATCEIQEHEIILQTYLGIGSVIHNRNALGFFKVRGKFSF